MFDALVTAIQNGVDTKEIGGYFSRNVYHPPKESEPDAVTVHTLQSIADWVKADRDTNIDNCMIHVESPVKVSILSSMYGTHNQRNTYVEASCIDLFTGTFQFGRFLSLENFNIGVLSLFQDWGDRALVLESTGSITESSTVTYLDDGITPTVQTSAGVQRVKSVEMPVNVLLKPFRTFREVDQPTSPFILRIRKCDRGGLESGLFEADGGAWQLAAIESIKQWLKTALKDAGVPVIG